MLQVSTARVKRGNLAVLLPPRKGIVGGRLQLYAQKWKGISPYWADRFQYGIELPYIDVNRILSRIQWKRQQLIPRVRLSTGLLQTLSELVNQGVVEQGEVKLYHKFFVIPKKDGQWRPILPLVDLNPELDKKYFKVENLIDLSKILMQGDYGIIIDIKGAFNHLPMAPSARKLLGFMINGVPYRYKVASMGLRPVPRWWTEVIMCLTKIARRKGLRLIVYYDDILLLNQDRTKLIKEGQWLVDLLTDYGLLIAEKSTLVPSQTFEYLGIRIDTTTMSWRVPSKRLSQVVRNLGQASTRSTLPVKMLAKIVGQIQAMTIAMKDLRRHMTSLYRLLAKASQSLGWNGALQMTSVISQELLSWIPTLKLKNGCSIRKIESKQRMHIWTDACLTGWGGTDQYGRVSQGHFSPEERSLHINVLEARGLFNVLRNLSLGVGQANNVHVDNLVLMYALRKGYSTKSPKLNRELQRIQNYLLEKNVTITITWVPTELNKEADKLSRRKFDKNNWMLRTKFVRQAAKKWGPLNLDLFATHLNRRCPKFYSMTWQPGTSGVDAFQHPWTTKNGLAYGNPPWPIILKCLLKIQDMKKSDRVVLVVPKWESKPWWPILKAMWKDRPIIIPASQEPFLPESTGHQTSLGPPKWETMMCLVGPV